MDPVQIIITIALCIGALLVLGFLIWLTVALVMLSKAKKVFREVEYSAYSAHPLRPGASRVANRTGRPERVFGRNQRGPLL